MQITPISNNKTNFNGQIILKNTVGKINKNKLFHRVDFASIDTNHIESIFSNHDSFGGKEFHTVIKMKSGDEFYTAYKPEEIVGAKKLVDGNSKVIEPDGKDSFLKN